MELIILIFVVAIIVTVFNWNDESFTVIRDHKGKAIKCPKCGSKSLRHNHGHIFHYTCNKCDEDFDFR